MKAHAQMTSAERGEGGSLKYIGAHRYSHATKFCIMLTEPPVTQEIELDCEKL